MVLSFVLIIRPDRNTGRTEIVFYSQKPLAIIFHPCFMVKVRKTPFFGRILTVDEKCAYTLKGRSNRNTGRTEIVFISAETSGNCLSFL